METTITPKIILTHRNRLANLKALERQGASSRLTIVTLSMDAAEMAVRDLEAAVQEAAELRQQLAASQAVARKAVRQMNNAEEENARLRGSWPGAMAVGI